MSTRYANDIDESLRNAIREANVNYRITYKDMADNSGFNVSTLKAFVRNEGVRLPDERESLYCMIRLSRWLSGLPRDCDTVGRIFIDKNKHVGKNGGASVNGDLSDEIRAIAEQNGSLSVADKNNNLTGLKKTAKELAKILSCVNAEIAIKEGIS